MLRVIGIGSPFEGDRIGWDLVDALMAEDRPGIEFHKLDRPGSQLVPLMQGMHRVVLIDALLDAADEPLRWLSPGQLREEDQLLSSHGFGVAEALQLAEALHALPGEVVILGVSPHAGVDEIRAEVSRRIREMLS